MSATITYSAGTITPTIVDGYSAARRPRTLLHPILGTSTADVTFRPPEMRRGTLRLVFDEEAAAADAVTNLSRLEVFTFTSDDRDYIDMAFVIPDDAGDLVIDLDEDTRDVWIVMTPFQEVVPT